MEFLVGISPREYQEKIFNTCRNMNCLIVLPTGLGKTLVALMLSIHRIKEFPNEKILFLAPTRPLAEQHLNYFKKHLPELFAEMELFTGEVSAEKRKKLWEMANIIFSTPQCIANDVKNNLYNLKEVCLLIEDEAHRCLKNYDYNFVAKKYRESAVNQRILGMTASPGSEVAKIREICSNLSIEAVELRTRNSPDVKEYLQNLEFEKVMVDLPKEFDELRYSLKKIFEGYVGDLRMRNALFGLATKTELIKLQKKISLSLSSGSQNFSFFQAASSCAQAIKLQHALELLETQTFEGFKKYIEKLVDEAKKRKSKGVVKLVSSQEFEFIVGKTREISEKNMEHPKVGKAVEIIRNEMEKNSEAKIIIFTQFRDTASLLSKKINEFSNVRSKIFVGQAKKENTGLNQKEQKKIIEDFSNSDINVICATSIGEEGLDIPEVNAVVFYEPVSSAIRKIQRAGRTARLMNGKLIILVTKKTRDESSYYASMAREKKMHSAIGELREDMSKKYESKQKQENIGKYF
ncbi:DEAD/DEAH box helicase [Candidatus Pacearchaeota archaeon]|nr:DEAD/DEAH box helicase [Candidatus Pacearchaeota archaeon]